MMEEELPDRRQRSGASAWIVTTPSGVTMTGGAVLNDASHLAHHRHITDAVHQEGGKIVCRSCTPAVTATSPRWWPLGATGADQPFYPLGELGATMRS